MKRRQILMQEIKRNPLVTLAFVLGVPILYYCVLMVSLIISFNNVPNYVNLYDWLGNAAEVLRSTPAFSDALTIISEEWLLEIGFMNYDYGFGISEWSLNIMPFKFMLVVLLSALLLINFRLYRLCQKNKSCGVSKPVIRTSIATTGIGSVMVGAASMTMFWVVCCASPSWVVGLAMLGLVSVSAALTLDPLETYVMVLGFSFLSTATLLLLQSAKIVMTEKESDEHIKGLSADNFRRPANA